MHDQQIHRDMGRLEGKVESLETQVAEMKVMVGVMHDAIVSAKGGWRVLILVGSAAAAIGALMTKLLAVLHR